MLERKKQGPTIEGLWHEYSRTREIELRNELIDHYRPLVRMHAARLCDKLPEMITFDELCSAGYIGLLEAVQNYDTSKSAKFETFSQRRIDGAMRDWLREQDEQSRKVRAFERKKESVVQTLSTNEQEIISEEDIAKKMGLSVKRYNELTTYSRAGSLIRLSAQEENPRNDKFGKNHWDIEDKRTPAPEDSIDRKMLRDYITRGLNRDERLILTFYYVEGLSMAEIGQVLDYSESRISQLHKNVLLRLRKRFLGKDVA